MSRKIVNMHEAKTHLSRLIDDVQGGEEIVIARAGKPVARLAPLKTHRNPRRPGRLKGKIWISEDFYAPLSEEIAAAFRGERP